MQRQPAAQRLLAMGHQPVRQRLRLGQGGVDRGQGPVAGRGRIAVHREHGQEAVAHELQDLAPAVGDGSAHRLEPEIEDLDQLGARQPIGQRGEPAQVAEPQCGPDGPQVAALDLAVIHPPPGLGTEIGGQEVERDLAQDRALGPGAEHPRRSIQQVEIGRREAAASLGGVADDGGPGRVQEGQRQHQVVGHPLGGIGLQPWHVARALAGPPAEGLAGLVDHPGRAAQVGFAGEDARPLRGDLLQGPALPQQHGAAELGVERLQAEQHPAQVETGRRQLAAETFEQQRQVGRLAAALDEPEGKVGQRTVLEHTVRNPISA